MTRTWMRQHTVGLAAIAVLGTAIVAGFALMLWHADWLDGNLRGLTPDQRVSAIDSTRGRLIQLGAGMLAAGALIFTALNFWLSREGHVTDRYTKAIEQLGSERLDVRIGAIYALERVMVDSARDHPTIVEVLAAFIREHSPKPPSTGKNTQADETPPTTDVRAALTVLGRRPKGRREQGPLDLRATRLVSVDLTGANLTGANLTRANLTRANLEDAQLSHTDLTGANLTRTDLTRTNLSHADLSQVNLTSAHLTHTDLTGARIWAARLTGAYLTGVDLTGAQVDHDVLAEAHLTGVDLTKVKPARLAQIVLDFSPPAT